MAKRKNKQRNRYIQFVEYMVAGGAYFWAGYGVFFICDTYLGFSLWWAKQTANIVGWTVNFVLQRYWVFRNPQLKGHLGQVTGRYLFITGVNFILDYFIVYGLTLLGITPYIGQFVSAGFFTVWNYLWYRYFVFPERVKALPHFHSRARPAHR